MSTTGRRTSLARFAVCLVAALALAGCGADDDGTAPAGEPVGQEVAGSAAAFAQCRDWTGASEADKLATIAEIRSQVNREDAGVSASELSDEEALDVFEQGCSEPYADGFRLHVMYARAAAFQPLRDIAEGNAN